MELSDEERLDWLRLIRTSGIGPRTFRGLLHRFGSARAALDALPEVARRSGRPLRITTRAEAEREVAVATRLGARFLALGEPAYPRALAAIDTAPPLIAVRGAIEILSRPGVALVGSRNASAPGLAFTERLARGLGEAGLVVVSGLARGIDAKAHKAALATGTVAVLGGGLDRLYPPNHAGLADAILDHGGAIVAEMPFGWEPRARDFPRRNRVVSGLALGVVVVEAARRSGSLITARLALEQGREVFAVPGSPLDPRAEGTNDLIRQGATLCAAAEHVTSAIEPLVARGFVPEPAPPHQGQLVLEEEGEDWEDGEIDAVADGAEVAADTPEAVLLDLLSPAPITTDELVRLSGLPARTVQGLILELELAGRVARHGSGAVSLRP